MKRRYTNPIIDVVVLTKDDIIFDIILASSLTEDEDNFWGPEVDLF